jgi:hypothetical protein
MEGQGDDVAVGREAVGEGVLDAAGIDIDDGHEGAAGVAGHGGDEEADGAGADDESGRAGGGSGTVYSVDGDGEGLKEGGGFVGDVGWDSTAFSKGKRERAPPRCHPEAQRSANRKEEGRLTYGTRLQDG